MFFDADSDRPKGSNSNADSTEGNNPDTKMGAAVIGSDCIRRIVAFSRLSENPGNSFGDTITLCRTVISGRTVICAKYDDVTRWLFQYVATGDHSRYV